MANSGSNDGDRQGRRPGIGLFIVVSVVVFAVWGIWGLVTFYLGSADMATRGQFGDLFGGVNALFTGLAFAGLIFTIVLQRNELEMQREELALSRTELRSSVEAQQGSKEALAKQVEQLESSSRLSAISTLMASYGRLLDTLTEDERRLIRELGQARNGLQSHLENLKQEETELEGLQAELERIQRHLDDPQTTDLDIRKNLQTELRKYENQRDEQWYVVEETRQNISEQEVYIRNLGKYISDIRNKRDDINLSHDDLISHLEQQVEQSIDRTPSNAGNGSSDEVVGES